jgi:glycosyltransferase involved in cell wall biosynthesis
MIYIYSTNPSLITGGIAKSLQSLIFGFDQLGVEYTTVPTHEDGRSFRKIFLFLASICRLFIIKRGSIIYLNAGGKLSIRRKSFIGFFAKKLGHKTILHLHGPSLYDNLTVPEYNKSFAQLCLNMDKIIVLTSWWKEKLSGLVSDDKIEIIPNSIVIKQCNIDDEKRKQRFAQKNILFMSRLVENKGADLAILTLSRIKDGNVKLLIAGDGPDRKRLENLVLLLKLCDRVTFLGWIPDDEKEDLLNNTSLFLLPSRGDSFGMGYLEAMEFSIPCIGLKYRSIIDVFKHGKTGLQFDIDGTNDDIAQRIAKGVDSVFDDYEYYKNLSINSFDFVISNYNSVKVARDFTDLIAKLHVDC